jgi:hypothetical protein
MNKKLFEAIIDTTGFSTNTVDFDDPSSSEEAAIGFNYINGKLERDEAVDALISLGHSPKRSNAILDKALEWSYT